MTAAKHEDSFKEYVLDQLSGLSDLGCRPMFGGFGLYRGTAFFGIIHGSRLYLRVTADSVHPYRAQGMRPFQPNAGQTLRSYYEVPPNVLEDADALMAWAERAIECARHIPLRRPAGTRKTS